MGASQSTLSKSEIKKYATQFQLEPLQIQHYFEHFTSLRDRQVDTPTPWIVEKLFNHLINTLYPLSNDTITFEHYLSCLREWQLKNQIDRLDLLFGCLDYDEDGVITPSDLAIFISHLQDRTIEIGDGVRIRNDPRFGVVKYIGKPTFAPGKWIGMELHSSCGEGKNSGSVNGVEYFKTEKEGMGVFVPYHTVERQVDYLKAKQVIEGFGATASGLNRDLFIEKCMSDPWVLNRLEQT